MGISALFYVQRISDIENFASTNIINSENAELILADGQRVEISNKESKIEYAAGGSSLSLNDSSILEQREPVDGNSFNQVIVPLGKRSNVLLSDGTRVWLNSGSRLVYHPVFKGKSREVFLEGEGYFEVSSNKSMPFFVRTDACRVKVLGTKFLVQSFSNENEFNTVLVEGKVSLTTNSKMFAKEVELSPNQIAELSDSKDNFKISEVKNVENYISWIHGYLDFQNEDIVSLTNRISRYYNIVIEVRLSNVQTKFSGKLDLKEDPERILSGLSTITKTKFEKQGNKYVIFE
jgi:ferric-dicitrate binding protein FerR (iron transport regulator)